MNDVRTVRADAQANHERIVRAARELFAEEGVEVSLNAIARRAGVGNATLYRHFGSQEVLREAVFLARIEETNALLERLAQREDPEAELREYLRWILTTADLSLVGLVLVQRPYSREIAPVVAHTSALLENLLERAHTAGVVRDDLDLDAFRVATVALVHVGRNADIPARRKKEFLDVVIRGLR